jgi:hypothetical protein
LIDVAPWACRQAFNVRSAGDAVDGCDEAPAEPPPQAVTPKAPKTTKHNNRA